MSHTQKCKLCRMTAKQLAARDGPYCKFPGCPYPDLPCRFPFSPSDNASGTVGHEPPRARRSTRHHVRLEHLGCNLFKHSLTDKQVERWLRRQLELDRFWRGKVSLDGLADKQLARRLRRLRDMGLLWKRKVRLTKRAKKERRCSVSLAKKGRIYWPRPKARGR